MKKVLLISAMLATGVSADMMMDMAKDMAMSQAKTEAKTAVVKEVAGEDTAKKELANKVADSAMGKEDPMDKAKSDALSAVTGEKKSSDTTNTLKETAVDIASEHAEKTVGKEVLKKETAKTMINSVL